MSFDYHYNRIKYLQKVYKDTNVVKGEVLPKETRRKINENYYNKISKLMVQNILNEVEASSTVAKETHYIVRKIDNIKDLCRKCKEEQIIAVIILYVKRNYDNNLKEDCTRLWSKYDLTWKLYGRIVSNILREYNKKQPLPRNAI